MQLQFSVYRYNPDVDKAPHMQDYSIEVEEGQDMMVLDALLLLKEQDPTLSFRRSCREGVCGSDGMNMNGKNGPFRLMGFGHRVYKNHDPRATVMRESCHEVLDELQIDNPLFDVAMELERIALEDPYFVEKKLFPNVDFYSGIVLSAVGIPTNMFTCIFALSRTVGWISHWHEMLSQPGQKIGRPRQLYTGYNQRPYKKIEK